VRALNAGCPPSSPELANWLSAVKLTRAILRYTVALLVITYGFAKLNGSQFTILDSELDKPMGQVSGFWLTWYYFGYSKFYGNLIALAQIIGGVLLMFPRTTLLGSCLLLPIIANIILIDLFYAVDLGALLVALFIEVALLIIVRPHLMELYDLFWVRQKPLVPTKLSPRMATIGKYIVRVLLIVLPAIFTYWVANFNNRFPTPIDGTWDVVEVSPSLERDNDAPTVVFFERNRAHLCVFKGRDGSYAGHHFEVNTNERTIGIWQYWLQKGPQIFDGSYDMSEQRIRLNGRYASDAGAVMFVLRKRE
jgi:hypothetical protein